MNLTKCLPPKPLHVLDRERLMSKLIAWDDKKVVFIHAQAGQGKSTLAAEYLRTLKCPFIWFNMDQEDDDPAQFLSCLGQAVQHAYPNHLPTLPAIPQNQYSIGGARQGISRWIERLFGALPGTCLIVFDDCTIASSSTLLRRLLKYLIETTPPNIRFMIISRARPALGIAKLRATQTVGELTGDDLRFTNVEVRELFSMVFRMQISESEAALINSTAEGWPAGLVLMHEYLATLSPGARAMAIIDRQAMGFRTHVFDYLAQEVFSHLSPGLQRFLLRTSIVDYLPLQLIGLLTGLQRTASSAKPSISSMVQDLRDRNLFVTVMDDDASVLRYHALFREFLRKKLAAQTRSTELRRLYTLAADYFWTGGDPVRSIDLSLASGRYDRAVRQIESRGEEMVARGRTRTLIRWIETLPLAYGNRPWFLLYRAVTCRFTEPRTALTFFDLAYKGFRADRTALHRTSGMMHSLCGIIETSFYAGGNFRRMSGAAEMANCLLRREKRESGEVRARLFLAMGMAWFFIGRLEQGAEALQRALDLFEKQGDHFYQITSALYLTPCALYQGEFRMAREAVRRGFEALAAIPDEAGGRAALFLTKAMTALFEGNLVEAQKCIDRCTSLADVHALQSIGFLSLDIGGWIKIAQGNYADAVILLSECKRKSEELRNAFFSASAAHLLAIAYLFQGSLDKAKKESDYALAGRARSEGRLFTAIYRIASGAIHLKLGKYHQAERDLLTALRMLHRMKAVQQEANARLMLARLYRLQGKEDSARKHLQEGFCIGRERGFTYFALFDASELAELATAAIAQDICADYCARLVDNRAQENTAPLLKIHCLGGFRVVREHTLVRDSQWKSKRAKTLLKMLVAHDGQKVPRERAMELLWPGTHPARLRVTFNSMLHRLRKALEPEVGPGKDIFCIRQEGDIIVLDRERVWTDVEQFLRHVETAGRMNADQKQERIMEEYEKAVSLYQGDFLPEELYSDWAAPLRDRLRIQYLKALEAVANIAMSLGDRDRALAFHERTLLADPCNEKACCWLMTRYMSDGRRGEAIRTYERCERALSTEMDLEPEEKTRKLYRSIIEG